MEGLAALGYLRSLGNKSGRDPEIQQDQFVVGKLTDLYNNAPSDAAREIITQHMQSYAGALNPKARMVLSAYINVSPISPQKVKETNFRKYAGQRPEITVSGSEDINGYALQRQAQLKWDDAYAEFMTGQKINRSGTFMFSGPGEKPVVAHEMANGRLQVIPVEMEQYAKQLEGHSLSAVVANGGWIDEDIELRGSAENGFFQVRKRKNLFDDRKSLSYNPINDGVVGSGAKAPTAVPDKAINALMGMNGLASGEEEYLNKEQLSLGSSLTGILEMKDPTDRNQALNAFKSQHGLAGWNIIEISTPDPKRGMIGRFFNGPNKRAFTVVPGTPIVKELPDGSRVIGYRDTTKGRDHIYSDQGVFLNMGLEEWDDIINRDYAKSQGSATEDKTTTVNVKQPKASISVDEALKRDPTLLDILAPPPQVDIDFGTAYRKGLSRGREITLPGGPGSGVNRQAEAMRGNR